MRRIAVHFTILGLVACGSPKPAEEPAPVEAAPATTAPSSSEAEPELSAEAAALIAEAEGDGTAPAPAPGTPAVAGDKGKGYDFVYRVKPDELRIEVLSAAFIPKAKSVRVRGGWGVEISVDATSLEQVSLLASDGSPLAFAAIVHRPAEEKVGDERGVTKDLLLSSNKPLSFKRTWPGADQKPLLAGQELLLQVGLWGLGTTSDSRKPARKFFEVKLAVDTSGAATVRLQPPK